MIKNFIDTLVKFIVERPGTFVFIERFNTNLFLFFDRFYRSIFVWAVDRIQNFDLKEIKAFQLSRLKKMLVYASLNIPFWKKFFATSNLNPLRIESIDDLQFLPIMRRESIKLRAIDYCASGLDNDMVFQTSGSTGVPLQYYFNFTTSRSYALTIFYALKFLGLSTNLRILRIIAAPQRKIYFGVHINSVVNSLRVPPDQENRILLYGFIKKYKPELLFGWPTLLKELAEYFYKDNFQYYPKILLTCGEYMSKSQREELENIFKCRVYDIYGTAETCILAQECVKRDGYHINPYRSVLEIVDEAGNKLSNGENGRVIVTSFDNKPMMFIRYDTGDLGYIIDQPCSCGRKTPRLFFEGRSYNLLKLPDGRNYSVNSLIRSLDNNFGNLIKKLQFIQESSDKIVFKIVPTQEYKNQHRIILAQYIINLLKCSVPPHVDVQVVSLIEDLPSGKAQIFISKI